MRRSYDSLPNSTSCSTIETSRAVGVHRVVSTENVDVVIVGGGIIGLATAYYLGKQGKKALVIERDSVGSHASGFAYGALSPLGGDGIPGPVLPLAIEAMKRHRELSKVLPEETGVDIQFRLKSILSLAFREEEIAGLKANFTWQQEQQGYEVEWLNDKAVHSLEPRVSSEALGGVYTQGPAEVDPYRFMLALVQAAEKVGTSIRHGEVTGLVCKGDRVEGVLLKGEMVPCEEVVLAMGPWAIAASEWVGIPVPIQPLKGQILRLAWEGSPVKCTVGWSGNYASTKPEGLIWAGTTAELVGFDETPTAAARDKIMEALLYIMPSLESAELVQQTACLRPYCTDGLPILGRVPNMEGVYLATGAGRKGILLGPVMAGAIADLILRGNTELPVDPFDPGRFQKEKPS